MPSAMPKKNLSSSSLANLATDDALTVGDARQCVGDGVATVDRERNEW